MDLITQLILVFFGGIATGFVGSVAGCGGAISIPLLVILGIPPSFAIATERFASVGLNLAAIRTFAVNKKIIWSYFFSFGFVLLVSSLVNAYFVIRLDENFLKIIIIFLMILSLFLVIRPSRVGLEKSKVNKKKNLAGYFSLGLVSFFTSFAGGLGFLKYILVSYFFGTTYITANASLRPPWIISSIIVTIFFLIKGVVVIPIGIALFLGYSLGGHIGAITQIKKGNDWVRVVFIIAIFLSLTRLLLEL